MFTELEFGTWEEFLEFVPTVSPALGAGNILPTHLLFRGQTNAGWDILTTLERSVGGTNSIAAYYDLTEVLRPTIEMLTDTTWQPMARNEVLAIMHEYDTFSTHLSMNGLPNYSYLTYLRHHGFPSPLLDWSRSPYVAAFFAFQHAKADPVSIYVLSEAPQGVKIRSPGPGIFRLGQHVKTHKRHFLQQSDYTICVGFEDYWRFYPHTDTFASGYGDQDRMWKVTFPARIATEVLRELDRANVNAFSLTGTDESLFETLAARAFRFGNISLSNQTDFIEDHRFF